MNEDMNSSTDNTEVLDENVNVSTENVTENNVTDSDVSAATDEMIAQPVSDTNGEDNNKKKGKKKPVLIAIIVILVLAIAGVGGYLVYTKVFAEKKSTSVKSEVKKSKYRLSGNGLEDFDLRFLQLENESKNKVYSPLSIKYALAMLQEGAKGETKEQITNLIGDYKPKKYPNNEHMSFANAMFIRNTFKDKVREEYTNNLKEKYNAEVVLDEFSSPDNINNWVSDRTFKLINNLLDSVDQNNFFLINALAIDMNWKNRIQASFAGLPDGMSQIKYSVNYIHEKYSDCVSVIEGDMYPKMKFNGADNTKSVEVAASFNHYDIIKDKGEDNIRKTVKEDYEKYLEKYPDQAEVCPSVDEYLNEYIKEIGTNYKKSAVSTDFYVSDSDDVKVFAKDLQTYDNVTLQYVGIMPKKDDLGNYVKNIDAKKISEIISNMKEVKYESFKDGVITKIRGNIPLFKYDYELDLDGDLQQLGVKNVFDINKSDLSGMLDGAKQFINPAIHKADIEFSNDGIKAAAATALGGMGSATACSYDYEFEVPVEEIDVTFDKPYMYIIRDKATGEVWFTGTVYEPSTN